MSRQHLPRGPVLILLALCAIWGGNMAAIKLGSGWLSPAFSAFVRSLVASACLAIWMRLRGVPFFPNRQVLFHGVMIGLLFGLEFSLVYVGLKYTLASRAYVFLYTHPFFVALGGHYLLDGDRLHPAKAIGLGLAFIGVVILFARNWGEVSLQTLPGDLMLLGGGLLWGATTLYIKKFLPSRVVPLQTLFYQLLFSAPLLLAVSWLLNEPGVGTYSLPAALAMAYQCFIVAFASYLVWFELVHRYPASLLAAFTFFAPVFGVFISGALILDEPVTAQILISLILVSIGILLVNRPRAS